MVKKRRKGNCIQPVSLLLLEGDTEQVFYPIVRDKYLRGIRISLANIKGQGNINKQVVREAFKFSRDNPGDIFHVYCCIDSEKQKLGATPFDLTQIRREVKARKIDGARSINKILADPDIESWFFYDIAGIYAFLEVPRHKRNVSKYRPANSFGKRDLQDLFHQFGKEYISGRRAENFINNLNMERIVGSCGELRKGIELILKQARI